VNTIPNKEVRREHAHRKLEQLLVCKRGAVVVDDGTNRQEVLLDSPELALYMPPMIWRIQYKYAADAVLLVFASDVHGSGDHIRDYEEHRRLVPARQDA
jgi:hypothetical protein